MEGMPPTSHIPGGVERERGGAGRSGAGVGGRRFVQILQPTSSHSQIVIAHYTEQRPPAGMQNGVTSGVQFCASPVVSCKEAKEVQTKVKMNLNIPSMSEQA